MLYDSNPKQHLEWNDVNCNLQELFPRVLLHDLYGDDGCVAQRLEQQELE
jgi:hypothetical protein